MKNTARNYKESTVSRDVPFICIVGTWQNCRLQDHMHTALSETVGIANLKQFDDCDPTA